MGGNHYGYVLVATLETAEAVEKKVLFVERRSRVILIDKIAKSVLDSQRSLDYLILASIGGLPDFVFGFFRLPSDTRDR